MLYGNIYKLHLVPFIDKKITDLISESIKIINKGELGRFDLSAEGAFLLFNESETDELMNRKAEVHKSYMDVQIVISGSESIGYSNELPPHLATAQKFDNDIDFVSNVVNENFIHLNKGDFTIFYPGQIHRPLCRIKDCQKVIKAIIKIPAAYIAQGNP